MKNLLPVLFAVVFGVTASAQSAVTPPQMGFVQDSSRSLRAVYGLAGNFILGPAVAQKVVSQAFSGSLGLLKTNSSIAAFDSRGKLLASIDTAGGPALFAFSIDSATALAYVPSGNTLIEWQGGEFAAVPFTRERTREQTMMGAVLAVAFPSPLEASLFVQRNLGQREADVWEVHIPLGNMGTASQTALVGVHGPLLALPSGDLVFSDASGIVIRKPDASEVHIRGSLPADFSLQQMDAAWVQLTDLHSSARFAIRATTGREAFYQLPEASR